MMWKFRHQTLSDCIYYALGK